MSGWVGGWVGYRTSRISIWSPPTMAIVELPSRGRDREFLLIIASIASRVHYRNPSYTHTHKKTNGVQDVFSERADKRALTRADIRSYVF